MSLNEAEMSDDWHHSSILLISFRSTDFLRSDSFCQDDEDDDRDSELAGIEAPQLEFDEMGLELEANEGTGEVTQLPSWMRAAILLLLQLVLAWTSRSFDEGSPCSFDRLCQVFSGPYAKTAVLSLAGCSLGTIKADRMFPSQVLCDEKKRKLTYHR